MSTNARTRWWLLAPPALVVLASCSDEPDAPPGGSTRAAWVACTGGSDLDARLAGTAVTVDSVWGLTTTSAV